MRHWICCIVTPLMLAIVPAAAWGAPLTQEFLFKFDTPRGAGNLTLNFFDANGSFDAIKVVVPIAKNMTIQQKRDAVLSEFIQQAAKDKATLGWVFDTVPNDPSAFTVKNIPKYNGKTLVNVNPGIVDRSRELVNHVDRLASAPNSRGIITFASTNFSPIGDGSPALFHAGVDYNGTEYFSEVSASQLGSDLSGQHVAELLYQELSPQVSSFATIADPELTGSQSLVVDLLPSADPNADFGVSFGTTSLTGYVTGQLVGVPEPGSLALAATAGAFGLATWWRRRFAKLTRAESQEASK
jgi:hypothetical protein